MDLEQTLVAAAGGARSRLALELEYERTAGAKSGYSLAHSAEGHIRLAEDKAGFPVGCTKKATR